MTRALLLVAILGVNGCQPEARCHDSAERLSKFETYTRICMPGAVGRIERIEEMPFFVCSCVPPTDGGVE